jgi:lipoprotein LprG
MTQPTRRPVAPFAVASLLAALAAALTGCSGGSDAGPGAPDEALAEARSQLDDTGGVKLSLSADELPDGVDGLLKATGGGTHAPAFEGTVVLQVDQLSLDVPVVAVDGLVYAQLPFTTGYSEVDPAEYGAPDPAQLMDPAAGISSWLEDATGVEKGDRVRDGDLVLTAYAGTLPGETVAATIPSADETSDFPVTFRLTDDGQLASVEVSGPFYGDAGDGDYTVDLTDYGTDKDITAP